MKNYTIGENTRSARYTLEMGTLLNDLESLYNSTWINEYGRITDKTMKIDGEEYVDYRIFIEKMAPVIECVLSEAICELEIYVYDTEYKGKTVYIVENNDDRKIFDTYKEVVSYFLEEYAVDLDMEDLYNVVQLRSWL